MINDSMGESYLFIRYSGTNLPMSEVEEYANKFKLKDGSGSSGAKHLSNPVITVKNARKIGETFVLNSLNSNWFESDWLGTFWKNKIVVGFIIPLWDGYTLDLSNRILKIYGYTSKGLGGCGPVKNHTHGFTATKQSFGCI